MAFVGVGAIDVVVVLAVGAGEDGLLTLLFFLFFECLRMEVRSKCWRRNCGSVLSSLSCWLPSLLLTTGVAQPIKSESFFQHLKWFLVKHHKLFLDPSKIYQYCNEAVCRFVIFG